MAKCFTIRVYICTHIFAYNSRFFFGCFLTVLSRKCRFLKNPHFLKKKCTSAAFSEKSCVRVDLLMPHQGVSKPFQMANKWSVHVVSATWLVQINKTGTTWFVRTRKCMRAYKWEMALNFEKNHRKKSWNSYERTNVCTHTHISVYTHKNVCTHICTHICTHTYARKCVQFQVHTYVLVCAIISCVQMCTIFAISVWKYVQSDPSSKIPLL